MLNAGTLDQLQQVHELNRAFLDLVQSRAREGRACFGLPAALQRDLAVAGLPALEGAACFPRALFHADVGARCGSAELGSDFDEAERDLCLSILFAARHTSRHSAYQARLLFGLEVSDIERLRGSPLTLLRQLASAPGVLQCAFRERHWFWRGLLTATRPEVRRPAHVDGTATRHRAGLAAASPAARKRLSESKRLPRRAPCALTIAALGARAPRGQSWTR